MKYVNNIQEWTLQMCGGVARCWRTTRLCRQRSDRLGPELPVNMGEYILNNLKNNYFSPFLRDTCPFNHNFTVMYKSTSKFCYQTKGLVTVGRILTVKIPPERPKVFWLLNSSWLKQRRHFITVWVLSSVPAEAEGLVWAFSTFRYKACDCNFFWPVKNLFQCVWVGVCVVK